MASPTRLARSGSTQSKSVSHSRHQDTDAFSISSPGGNSAVMVREDQADLASYWPHDTPPELASHWSGRGHGVHHGLALHPLRHHQHSRKQQAGGGQQSGHVYR